MLTLSLPKAKLFIIHAEKMKTKYNMAKDISQSIRQKLLNLSHERKEGFEFILAQYLMQRILYRLSISEYVSSFLLKGALLFWVWNEEFHRPTRDIDLLGFSNNDENTINEIFTNILKIEIEDGLIFDLTTLKVIKIKEDAKYQGIRLRGAAYLAEFDNLKQWWGGIERKGREDSDQAWQVDIDTIKANGYNLDIKNPHQPEQEKQYSSNELLDMLHQSFTKGDELLEQLKKELA